MNINISTKNIELTEAIKNYVNKKISTLGKFFPDATEVLASVTVGKSTHHHKEGEVFMTEINLIIDGRQYHTDESAADLYAAIDKVQSELERKITSGKSKRTALLKRGGRAVKNLIRRFYRY